MSGFLNTHNKEPKKLTGMLTIIPPRVAIFSEITPEPRMLFRVSAVPIFNPIERA